MFYLRRVEWSSEQESCRSRPSPRFAHDLWQAESFLPNAVAHLARCGKWRYRLAGEEASPGVFAYAAVIRRFLAPLGFSRVQSDVRSRRSPGHPFPFPSHPFQASTFHSLSLHQNCPFPIRRAPPGCMSLLRWMWLKTEAVPRPAWASLPRQPTPRTSKSRLLARVASRLAAAG